MPLLLLFERSSAQKKCSDALVGDTVIAIPEPSPSVMGKVALPDTSNNDIDTVAVIENKNFAENDSEYAITTVVNKNLVQDTTFEHYLKSDIVMGIMISTINDKRKDTVSNLIRKTFHNQPFKILPNPASKNAPVQIELKNAGSYTIQLLDNQSQLLAAQHAETVSSASSVEFNLPSNIAEGAYYICVVDEKKKKQHTAKLIIQ